MRANSPGYRNFYARRLFSVGAIALVVVLWGHAPARAQLQVTEVMHSPLDQDVWEWIEVRNSGGTPIDLNGAYGDRLGDPRILQSDPVSIDSLKASNTVIPAGGVAVLYDANLPGVTNADFDDQIFRDAWGLSGSVPLVGVDFFPELEAGGSIGFWEDYGAYSQDLVNPGTGFEVGSFDHALFSVDLSNGFPTIPSGSSMSWNGQGSYQDGANWSLSGNTVTSVSASMSSTINSTLDFGSPGAQPAGTFLSALVITEIMVQPDSDQPDWEWIEVYNGSDDAIDFDPNGDGPHVLDDSDGPDLLSANITSGLIPRNSTAVFFNGDALTIQDMQDAWDPNGAMNTNFIPVTNFSELATSGTIGIWSSYDAYTSEDVTGPGRSTENAESVLVYDDDGSSWPNFDGVSSNYLTTPSADPNDGGYGLFWAQSGSDPNNLPAFNAEEVLGSVEVHAGGDIGSPGVSIDDADFDDDLDVDGKDFLAWQRGLATGTTHAEGDANGDGVVNHIDLAVWEAQYGGSSPLMGTFVAVPEPSNLGLFVLALSGWTRISRRSRRR